MQDRSLKGAEQRYGRGRAEAGAGEEQDRSRAGAGKEQESGKVGVVHIPNFTNVLRHRSLKDSLLVGFDRSVQ